MDIMASAPWVMGLTLIILNGAIILLLRLSLKHVDVKEALREKAGPAAAFPPVPGGPDNTSYSRVSGMVGAIVLACFFWALANVVVFQAFTQQAQIEVVLKGVGTFILSGSALFAPYAFNQLTGIFK